MQKVILFSILVVGLIFSSCSKDEDNNDNPDSIVELEGTTWHSIPFEEDGELEYYILDFNSGSEVAGSAFSGSINASWTGTYVLNENIVTIDNGEESTGTIDGNELDLLVDPDPNDMTIIRYIKQ